MASILLSLSSLLRRDKDSNNVSTRALCSTGGSSGARSSRDGSPWQDPKTEAEQTACPDGYVPFPDAVSKGPGCTETSKPLSRRLYLGLSACLRTRRRKRPSPRKKSKSGSTATTHGPEGVVEEPDVEEGLARIAQGREMVPALPPVELNTTEKTVKPRTRNRVAAIPQMLAASLKTGHGGITKKKRKARVRVAKHVDERLEALSFATSVWQRTIPDIAEALVFWVDGSFSSATKQGGAAVVLSRGELPLTFEAFAIRDITNSVEVELYAIEAALEGAIFETRGNRGVRIFVLSDCTPAIDCATLHLKRSKQSAITTQLVKSIGLRLRTLHAHGCTVEMRWVPGHAGATGNVYADRIAGFARSLAGRMEPRSDGGVQVYQVAATLLKSAVENTEVFRGPSLASPSGVAPVSDPHAGGDPQVVVQGLLDAHWGS